MTYKGHTDDNLLLVGYTLVFLLLSNPLATLPCAPGWLRLTTYVISSVWCQGYHSRNTIPMYKLSLSLILYYYVAFLTLLRNNSKYKHNNCY